MNKDSFAGQFKIMKGKLKEKWGKLTDDELTQVNGKRDQFLGLLQKKYGFAKDRAEKELSEFERGFSSTSDTTRREDFRRRSEMNLEEGEEEETHRKAM